MSQPLIMSFRPDAAEMCLDGRKTMTRRIAADCVFIPDDSGGAVYRNGRRLWRVGSPITTKASRTGNGIGKVMCTGLRVEHVQDITEEDAMREGVEPMPHIGIVWLSGKPTFHPAGLHVPCYRDGFSAVWRGLYPTGPNSWDSNPLVVVIEFRPMAADKEGIK